MAEREEIFRKQVSNLKNILAALIMYLKFKGYLGTYTAANFTVEPCNSIDN